MNRSNGDAFEQVLKIVVLILGGILAMTALFGDVKGKVTDAKNAVAPVAAELEAQESELSSE